MSENEKNGLQPDHENIQAPAAPPDFDFDYITQALGLIPIHAHGAAINPQLIVDISYVDDESVWIFDLQGGESYGLDAEEMAELENTIRMRSEIAKQMQKDAIKQNLKAQADAVTELSGAVTPPGKMILGPPQGKRFRQ